MKKTLLSSILVFAVTCIVNAQAEGYNWYFGTAAPYSSNPAITGSAGTYSLTTVTGTGGGVTVATGETLPSCGPLDVSQYTKPFGLVFSNSPQYVNNTYAIQMVVNVADVTGTVRLVGFSGTDNGIYITGSGSLINFYNGTDHPVATTINSNTWYDLVFVRDNATKKIYVYQDGALLDFYTDAADEFVPQPGNGNTITFLKDEVDNVEESDGKIAKISIYNKALTPSEVVNSYSNICNPSFQLDAPDFRPQGYQWSFASAPFNSFPAKAASTGAYQLAGLGSGSIATSNDPIGLGTSCVGNIDVTQYTKPYGLQFSNAPQYVGNSYTVEMASNFDGNPDGFGIIRLVGFNDLAAPPGSGADDGIYIDPAGLVVFFSAAHGNVYPTGGPQPPIVRDGTTWYHLLFTRDAGTKTISYYQDNVLIGTYADTDDLFVPKLENDYSISLFKDDMDNTEESSGKIAKAAIFNYPLNVTEIQQRFDNICNTSDIILPVSLTSFIAKKAGQQVELTWTTAAEIDNLGFEIQRSTNGSDYATIAFVKGAGNSTTEITYHFIDPAPLSGKSYYRLKQINFDNKFKLSAIRSIDFARDIQDLQLYPNPANSNITIVNVKAGDLLSVFDSQGRPVIRRRANNAQELIPVNKLSSGIYIFQVTDNNGNTRSVRFSKL